MWPSNTDLIHQIIVFARNTAAAIIILAAFWLASRILERLISRVTKREHPNADLVRLLARSAKIALQTFGVITALGTAGVNVAALVAGLGLTGFAVGFAFRDVLSNLLAGVLLLLFRPFSRGDRISVSGLDGAVTGIDLRYTTLDGDGKTILIPNGNLFTNPIIISRRT